MSQGPRKLLGEAGGNGAELNRSNLAFEEIKSLRVSFSLMKSLVSVESSETNKLHLAIML